MRDAAARASARSAICSFRPFPLAAVRAALQHAKRVVVLEKCLAVGPGRHRLRRRAQVALGHPAEGYTVIAGLGGRAITRASLTRLFEDAGRDELEPVTFLDLERRRRRAASWSASASAPHRPDGRSDPAPHRHGRLGHRLNRETVDGPSNPSSSTRPAPSPSATGCSPRTSARCRPTCSAPTRSTPATAPARAAARRSARATRSTRRCARPTTS